MSICQRGLLPSRKVYQLRCQYEWTACRILNYTKITHKCIINRNFQNSVPSQMHNIICSNISEPHKTCSTISMAPKYYAFPIESYRCFITLRRRLSWSTKLKIGLCPEIRTTRCNYNITAFGSCGNSQVQAPWPLPIRRDKLTWQQTRIF